MKSIKLTGVFNAVEYDISHKVFRLRRIREKGGIFFYTDLIFFSTYFIELPTRLQGVSVYLGKARDYEHVRERCPKDLAEGGLVYRVRSGGNNYWVGAWAVAIKESSFDPFVQPDE